jgi:hypothetical protein
MVFLYRLSGLSPFAGEDEGKSDGQVNRKDNVIDVKKQNNFMFF